MSSTDLCQSENRRRSKKIVAAILALHVGMLAWGALRHSPTIDEAAHLASGISHLKTGRFGAYRVNPPLVRSLAAMPVLLAKPAGTDWFATNESPGYRPEWDNGRYFTSENGPRTFELVTIGRWACIPFSLLGAIVCYQWASELYGGKAAILSLAAWCFSPNIIANGQLLTPDVGATAMGALSAYLFWHWLKCPRWELVFLAGVVLGLTQLTKSTWIVLFALWPVLWIAWSWSDERNCRKKPLPGQFCQLTAIMLLSLFVVNLGYGFEKSFTPVGQFRFISSALRGPQDIVTSGAAGNAKIIENRFAGTTLGKLPVPLPANFVLGIDHQKRDFERGYDSYLRGTWKRGGWWYYYLYALAIKVPLGTWLLLFLAIVATALRWGYSAGVRDELFLFAPATVVLTLVSSQTGFNHHMRYVLPAFPFLFIWISKVAKSWERRHSRVAYFAAGAFAWSLSASLMVYPHSMSYFNELVGGPKQGHWHLGSSNVAWGQNLLYAKRWLANHESIKLTGFGIEAPYSPNLAGIQAPMPPSGPRPGEVDVQRRHGPVPGWHIISTNLIHLTGGNHLYFLEFEPVDRIGYSLHVYHITLDDANRVRRKMGLSELTSRDAVQMRGTHDATK